MKIGWRNWMQFVYTAREESIQRYGSNYWRIQFFVTVFVLLLFASLYELFTSGWDGFLGIWFAFLIICVAIFVLLLPWMIIYFVLLWIRGDF